ncbi:MAG: glycoside hydrolase family 3 N-terminal domain-containing protein, partial [Planctomycetota bacterium]
MEAKMADKESKLKAIIDGMTIAEKVGQCLVVDFTGITINPHLVDLIEKCNVAGLRVQSDCRIKAIYHPGAVTADKIRERSFRNPTGGCKDVAYGQPAPACRASEYASVLNKVKYMAMNRKHAIPLHITLDQEGAGYENFVCGNVRQLPSPMGIAATDDTELAYRAFKVMARQLKLSGFSWIHWPVLDVNTNPKNPEIGIRAFSDD